MLFVTIGAVIGLELEDDDPTTKSTGKFLFVLAVIINTIVFMNLLLAVVGNTYTMVTDQKTQFFYEKLVDRICMLQRLFFFLPKKDNENHLIFLAKQCREYNEQDPSQTNAQQHVDPHMLDSVQEAVQSANAEFSKKMEKILDFRLELIQKMKENGANSRQDYFA